MLPHHLQHSKLPLVTTALSVGHVCVHAAHSRPWKCVHGKNHHCMIHALSCRKCLHTTLWLQQPVRLSPNPNMQAEAQGISIWPAPAHPSSPPTSAAAGRKASRCCPVRASCRCCQSTATPHLDSSSAKPFCVAGASGCPVILLVAPPVAPGGGLGGGSVTCTHSKASAAAAAPAVALAGSWSAGLSASPGKQHQVSHHGRLCRLVLTKQAALHAHLPPPERAAPGHTGRR